ncbi:MAG TPA: MATE family efflux transporter [Chitinivibrionales bacterium]
MNTKKAIPTLTSGPIASTLVGLSAPMFFGIVSMMSFNLIDTFFVSRLGTLQLAALALTFPVAMVIATFTLGLGVGAMAAISKSIGKGEQSLIRRLSTDALTLSTLCVMALSAAGLLSVGPLFRMLGATDATMPFIKQYMSIWYPGMVFYVVPMIGSNILRATGDTLTPSIIMIAGMVINAMLDPVFIFGFGPIPRMEIAGAAAASVVSRGLMLAVSLWILHFKKNLIARPWPGWPALIFSWKTILATGLAVAVSNAVIPIAMGIITKIVARFGAEAIAGFGVATRIEALGFTLIIAMSNGLSPFVGQNFGAKRFDRIEQGIGFSSKFSLSWGVALCAVFFVFGKPLARLFSVNELVISTASLYLWLISVSLGLRGVHQIIWTALNVLGRPYDSLALELVLTFGLWIPLSLAGAQAAGITGIFTALSISNVVAGAIAYAWAQRVVRKEKTKIAS